MTKVKSWALSSVCLLALMDNAASQPSATSAVQEEVVVTARRREERIQDVPLSVTALTPKVLEQQNITNINSLTGKVPNLVVAPGTGSGDTAPVFAIRGLSVQDLTGLSDPAVSMYVNEVVVPRPLGANIGFYDLESVQILRGPQGTLFGRNTTGGAILVTEAAPTREFEGYIQQSIENYGTYQTLGAVNVPIGDWASLRVAGNYKKSDGWLTDVITGKKINFVNENAWRGSFDLHPSDRWNSLFVFNYAKSDNGGTGSFARPNQNNGGPEQLLRDYQHTASGVPQFAKVEVISGLNKTTYHINDKLLVKNIANYRQFSYNVLEDPDGTHELRGTIQRITHQYQVSEELQLQGTHDWGNWIVGAFFFKEQGDEQAPSTGAALGSAGNVDPGLIEPNTDLRLYNVWSNTASKYENISKAVFAQGTFKLESLLHGLSATVGARQNWDTRKVVIQNRGTLPIGAVGTLPAIGAGIAKCRFTFNNNTFRPGFDDCNLPLETSFQQPTYNFSLDYKPTNDILIYAASRKGYKTGGYGARAARAEDLRLFFAPEKVNDYEIGIKADWRFNGMFLRTNATFFHMDFKNIQRLLTIIPEGTTQQATVTVNAGNAKIAGEEYELIFRPFSWVEFNGFWSHTDAKFRQFRDPFGFNLAQFPVARAPKNIMGATLRFFIPIDESAGDLNFAVNYTHQDKFNGNDTANGVTGSGPTATVNYEAFQVINVFGARDILNFDGAWNNFYGTNVDLSFFVSNALNQQYTNPQLIGNGGGGINSVVATPPRTFGGRIRYNF